MHMRTPRTIQNEHQSKNDDAIRYTKFGTSFFEGSPKSIQTTDSALPV